MSTETFDMDFRPAASDEQPSVVKHDGNRPRPYPHPTTAVHAHQPVDNYHVGATHGQRRDPHDVLCE